MNLLIKRNNMILDNEILIGLCGRNFAFYEQKGYIIPRKTDKKGRTNFTKGTKILVKINDLMPTSKVKVLCKCEACGIERKVFYDTLCYRKNSQYLITKETLCVKCSNKKLFTGSINPNYKHGNNRYCEYRWNAQNRNLCFDLTVDDFEKLTNQKCHYCGNNNFIDYNNKKSRGIGIDRKNNKIGYTLDNCVSCCYRCNFFKNKMDYSIFIKHIRDIYFNTKAYEI